jgi:uncharacterized radical SAM protein YgiQ
MNKPAFLPTTRDDLASRGWDELDVIIVTGDAYVDHPSYGAAMVGRSLESAGFKVGIIAQPNMRDPGDFMKLGRPRLFFGVTAGNLDSMVANYTANRKPRGSDDYSPGGKAGLRPDRATIAYTNMLRQLFPGVGIVIGGIEASLRRLAHYDYWSDKVRRSILPDSKADILVYGMGETQAVEIARRLASGGEIGRLDPIRGTVVMRGSLENLQNIVIVPSFEEASKDNERFNEAFRKAYAEADPFRGRTVAQKHGDRYVVQFPPASPLSADELDSLYSMRFVMRPHPSYDTDGGVPGFETVRFSVTSHRGCPGECSFCSLYMHQGRIVQSRSLGSVLDEIRRVASRKDFNGTITDIGGPTANLYMSECAQWKGKGACVQRRCIAKGKCPNLKLGYSDAVRLWRGARKIARVKHIFIGSGVRYDLITDKESDEYLQELCREHVSGRLKVAPEHSEDGVLDLMRKPSFDTYIKFVKRYEAVNRRLKKKQFLVSYLISAHPGSRLEDALELALKLKALGINPEQIQDYLPLPMTASASMYHTGRDPFTGRAVYVAKGDRERKLQRALVQSSQPENRRYVIEALRRLGKPELIGRFLTK